MFRLILIAIVITYFVGCSWYYISKNANDPNDPHTFIKIYKLDDYESSFDKLIVTCYFALSTLATIGFSDYIPISRPEMIASIVIMIIGIGFFSYIMSSFIEII